MKSVIFCGSSKYMEEMKDWDKVLKQDGVDVFVPVDYSNDPAWSGTEEEQREIAHQLTWDHFEKIPNYDVVFIFNKDGYCGPSTTLEIGYAVGCKKEVYALDHDADEVCRDVLYSKICQTPEQLLTALADE